MMVLLAKGCRVFRDVVYHSVRGKTSRPFHICSERRDKMPLHHFKAVMGQLKRRVHILLTTYYIIRKRSRQLVINRCDFDSFSTKSQVSGFLGLLHDPEFPFMYRYSHSCSQPTLYASAYACMTKSMLGELTDMEKNQKADWARYFDSFQEQHDGLFYDPVVQNEIYADTDWWGHGTSPYI